MTDKKPCDLFIECRSCGVENMIADYDPSMRIFCSQCRDHLIDDGIVATHVEYVCQECDTRLILLEDTEIEIGESACSCGSTDLLKVGKTALPKEAAQAGGLVEEGMDDDEVLEDTDWLRPSDSGNVDDDNYENMFNQDPGQN